MITGSIAFDTLMSFPGRFSEHLLPDQLENISVSFLVDSLTKRRGGCAANIAYNLALLGEKACLVGTVGEDFGEYRKTLEDTGVDTSGVRVITGEYTASFFANTDLSGNQIASFYTGAMRYARDISLRELSTDKQTLVVISPNDPEAMNRMVRECQELKVSYMYDPGQQIIRLEGEDLKKGILGAACVIMNEYELGMMKKKTGMAEDEITEGCGTLVVTLGEKGSRIVSGGREWIIPPVKPGVIADPTGVGDAFRAGLLKGMSREFPWDLAGRMGSLAAAYVLETDGPQNHSYSLKEFVSRYDQTFGPASPVRSLLSEA
jgi:adenosine kinase